MTWHHSAILTWLALANAFAFVLFGLDKFLAGRQRGRRVSEFLLLCVAALGGWPGALLAMLLFRHKTAKLSFQVKFAVACLVWTGLLYAALRMSP